jgi:hypothetical protein
MADPMQEDVEAVQQVQVDVAGLSGHDEMLMMIPDRDDTHENMSRKRTAADEEEEDSSRKRRKGNPPPKKLNNEQWDLMFDRLVEYKRQHGVSLT